MRRRLFAITVTIVATFAATLVGPAAPARAATADAWGFAYVDNPTAPVWTVLDPARQWGTWKAAFPGSFAQGIKLAPGRFLVRFPHIGFGSRGNVHVSAVNRTGHYCTVVRWYQSGVDEIVDVQCFKPGGTRDDSRFTVLWTVSSGVLTTGPGSYASVQGTAVGAIAQAYNSSGGGVGVLPLGVGLYEVKFGAVGSPGGLISGNVQATAIQPNAGPRRCKIRKWGTSGSDIIAYVSCFDAAGAPVNSDFTASYHRERSVVASFAPPKYIGYLASALGGETNFNYPLGGFGFNNWGPLAPAGRYQVKYPQLFLAETHTQVVAHGGGSNYCNLTQVFYGAGPDALVDVICFDNTGTPTPHSFLSTFTSRA